MVDGTSKRVRGLTAGGRGGSQGKGGGRQRRWQAAYFFAGEYIFGYFDLILVDGC